MFKKTTLKNGLRIITVPMENSQTVTVLLFVSAGSKYEKKEISGISHFLEHMYFKGTKKRPTYMAIAETLDKAGGNFGAFTGEELTGYFAKVAANQLGIVLDWTSDIYLNSLFPPKEIEKERKVIIEEINMYYDTPMRHISDLWRKLLYNDQPAGWNIAGTKESVSKITRKQILDYMNSRYVASNTLICIAGKFSSANIINNVKNYFSEIKNTSVQSKLPVIENQKKPEVLIQFKETDQTHLALGVRTCYNLFHPQKYPTELLGVILGGMMSSRLFDKIREKLGLAYYIRTETEFDTDTGYLVSFAGINNSGIKKAISVILKEYQRISQTKVPDKELKRAKDNLKGKLVLSLETSDAQASFYGVQELLEKKILTPEKVISIIDKITTNDILKVAKDIFRPEKLNLALIGPIKDKSKFEKLLKW